MNLLNLEDEKVKSVKISGYKFSVRYMSPLDRIRITQKRMGLQAGSPVEALTQDDFIFFENVAIVDQCVEDYPEGFKANESCANWDNMSMINDLAHEIRTHTTDLEAKLKKNKPDIGGECE